jgi:glycosyltransferase involved in cell wall biosynthesis
MLHGLLQNVHRISALRSALRSVAPEAIISLIERTNVLTLLATRGLAVPVLICERIDPRAHGVQMVWAALRRLTYSWADALVVQTNSVLSWAGRELGARRVLAIPNPVPHPATSVCDSVPTISGSLVVAMGRLVRQKGFDMLLRAAATALPRHSDWSLVILGDGPERGHLERLIIELGLRERVTLPGWQAQPGKILRHAHLFVLSSRYEGFPNALCEAMASGVAVVSFACPSGPDEIIRDGVDGILVAPGDVAALASAMDELMADAKKRQAMGRRATEITQRYSEDRIMQMWDQLIDEVIKRRRNARPRE